MSIVFYGSTAMLFFGAFAVRYRLELILAFPLIAELIMAMYLSLAFQPSSPVEHPEKLYRERGLLRRSWPCSVLMVVLLFVDIPLLADILPSWLPPAVTLRKPRGHGEPAWGVGRRVRGSGPRRSGTVRAGRARGAHR